MNTLKYSKLTSPYIFFRGFDLAPDAPHIWGIPHDLAVQSVNNEEYATLKHREWDDHFSFGDLRSYLTQLSAIPSRMEPLLQKTPREYAPADILHAVLRFVSKSMQAQIVAYVRSTFPYYTYKPSALSDVEPYHHWLYNTMTLSKGLLNVSKGKEHLWDWVHVTSNKLDPQFQWAKDAPYQLKGILAQKDFSQELDDPFEMSFAGVHVEDLLCLSFVSEGLVKTPAIRVKGDFSVAPKVVFILTYSTMTQRPLEPFNIDLQGFDDSWVFVCNLPCTTVVVRTQPHVVEVYPPKTHPATTCSTATFTWEILGDFYSKAVTKASTAALTSIGGDLSEDFWEVFRHDAYPFFIAPYRSTSKEIFTHWIKRREKIHDFLDAPL